MDDLKYSLGLVFELIEQIKKSDSFKKLDYQPDVTLGDIEQGFNELLLEVLEHEEKIQNLENIYKETARRTAQ